MRDEANGDAPSSGPITKLLLVRGPFLIGGSLMLVAMMINLANVIGRYLFGTPVYWAEEVLVYLFIWAFCITIPALTYERAHVRMDLLTTNLKSPYRQIQGLIEVTLIVICSIFVAVQSWKIVSLYADIREVSLAAHIPRTWTHSAPVVGFSLMATAALVGIKSYMRGRPG